MLILPPQEGLETCGQMVGELGLKSRLGHVQLMVMRRERSEISTRGFPFTCR